MAITSTCYPIPLGNIDSIRVMESLGYYPCKCHGGRGETWGIGASSLNGMEDRYIYIYGVYPATWD